LKVKKMWDQAAAQELQVKAEAYLLEHKPRGYKRSAGAEADRNQFCLGIDQAYYRRDVGQHKKAVDEMVLSTLKDYARWLGRHRGEKSSPGPRKSR
jgi:hypothetical protein